MSPIKAIKEKCLDCCCGNKHEVDVCGIKDCPLFPFRKGKNPNKKMSLSEDQRKKAGERMKEYWKKKKESEDAV